MSTLTVQEHSLYYTHLCLSHFISIIKHSHLLILVFLYSLFVRTLRGWVISCLVDILADPNGRGTMIVYASNAKFSHFFSDNSFYIWFLFCVVVFFLFCVQKTHYLSQKFAIPFAVLIYLVYFTFCPIIRVKRYRPCVFKYLYRDH